MNGRPGCADLLACLSIGVFVALCYAPELLGYRSFFFFDVSSLNIPARDWGFRQLREGYFPAWCSHWYVGFPFIAESQSGIYYPPNYFFFLLFPSWYATTLAYCFHLWLAGVGAYLLFRRSASVSGAWIGAASFALGGRLLEHQIHAAVVETIAWLPWIILGAVKFIEDGNRRAVWWAALAAGMQALAGSFQTVVICHVALFLSHAALAIGNGRAVKRSVVASTLIGLAAVSLSSALLLPTFELFRQSHRSGGGTAEWANFGAISPLRWVQFLLPGAFGSPAYMTAWLDDRDPVFETGLYHGGIVLVLAVVGMYAAGRRKRAAFVGTAMILVGLSLAAGEMHLVGAGLRRLPIFGGIRVPARFLLLVGLGMCQLASLGWDELVERGRLGRRQLTVAVAVLLLAAGAAMAWMYGWLLAELPAHINPQQLEAFFSRLRNGMIESDAPRLAIMLLAAILCLFASQSKAIRVGVMLCLALDLMWTARRKYPTIDPSFHAKPAIVDAIKRHSTPDPPRVFVRWTDNQKRKVDLNRDGWRLSMDQYRRIGDCLYYERGPLFDVGVFPDVGQLPLQPQRLAEFRGAFDDVDRLLRVMGVSFSMNPTVIHSERMVERGIGCVLEKVPEPAPYAFVTNAVERLPTARVLERLASPTFDPTREVVLEGEATPPQTKSDARRAIARWLGPNELEIEFDGADRGYVLVHEMFDAGWKATIDGKPVPIERANWLFMAVPVGQGPQRVTLNYAPFSVRLGRWISAAALIVWLVVGCRRWRPLGPVALHESGQSTMIALLAFALLFILSAVILHANWIDAWPTVLDVR